MVAVKLMGIMDIIAVIVMVLLHFSIGSWRITIAFALYLILKGFAFRGNVHSMIDTVIGVYMIFLLFGLHSVITFVPAIYLLQKAVFSIMS